MPTATPLFTQHSRSWRENRYVYPVISRRSRGLSIGVNLSPDKSCTFDCVYCSVDRGVPGLGGAVDLAILEQELDHLLALAASGDLYLQPPFDQTPLPLRRLNDLALSGDGEPTTSPQFLATCRLSAELLRRHGLRDVKIVVITNATVLHKPQVVEALAFLDSCPSEIWAKLDAGTEEHYHRVDRSGVPLTRVLDNLAAAGRLRPLVLQSMFLKLAGEPPSEQELEAYLGRLRDLLAAGCRILRVQVYTVARATADAAAAPLDDAALDSIAERLRALGLAADTFYGPR